MDIIIVIVLCLVGIVLILVEIFLIPGITIAAIGGALFSVGGIYYAYVQLGTTGGTVALVSATALFGVVFLWLIKSKALDKVALKTDIKSTIASKDSLSVKEGDDGVTLSRLNPMGKVRVNGVIMEAKTFGEFIDENTSIIVLQVSLTQLIVKVK